MRDPKTKHFFLIGGLPCLDFVNTAPDGGRVDTLLDFQDLLTWLSEAQLIPREQLSEARRRWSGTPEARLAHRRALALRKSLREMLEQVLGGRGVPEASVTAINEVLRSRGGYPELIRTPGGLEQKFRRRFDSPCQLLAPIAEWAIDLLCNRQLSRVKRCANPGCGFYFYEVARNRRRRWCSMKTCGNRMKSAAFRRRQRLAR
jgi:predicted RNA-binding Zn ribbon-like protein